MRSSPWPMSPPTLRPISASWKVRISSLPLPTCLSCSFPYAFKMSLFLVDLVSKRSVSIKHFAGLLLHLPFLFKFGLFFSEFVRGKCQRRIAWALCWLAVAPPIRLPHPPHRPRHKASLLDHTDAAQSTRIKQIQKVFDLPKKICHY